MANCPGPGGWVVEVLAAAAVEVQKPPKQQVKKGVAGNAAATKAKQQSAQDLMATVI